MPTLLAGLFQGVLGKIVAWLVMIVLVGGTAMGVYFGWRHMVTQQALAEYNKRQLEEILKKQQQYEQQVKELQEIAQQLAEQMAKTNAEAEARLQEVLKYIEEHGGEDKPASELLKEVIKMLSGSK